MQNPSSIIGETCLRFRLAVQPVEIDERLFVRFKYLPTTKDIADIKEPLWFQPTPTLEINLL